MAWGQGELVATPAAVARVASAIANNGTMMQNRFVLDVNGVAAATKPGQSIVNDTAYAKPLTGFMKKQRYTKKPKMGI